MAGLRERLRSTQSAADGTGRWSKANFLGSAARTTAITTAICVDTAPADARGILVVLTVTAASGTGGLTMSLDAHNSGDSTAAATLKTAAAGVTATGRTTLLLYPSASAGYTDVVNGPVPPSWSVSVAVGDASSYTYSIDCYYV